jgi:histone-lysine N-methyltransferase SETMAR
MSLFVPESDVQRGTLITCYNSGKSAIQAHQLLVSAYGEHALGRTRCFEWYKRFKAGDFSAKNKPRGRPPKIFEDRDLEALLAEDDTQTQEQLAEQLKCDQHTVSVRLKQMGKIQKLGKWVPHELLDCQKEKRSFTSGILFERFQQKNFLHQIVTGDEKWIYFNNSTRKRSWTDRGRPPNSTPRPNRFGKKVMLCVFWDQKGVLFWELLQPGQTVNATRYVQQLRDLDRVLPQKRPESFQRRQKGRRVILLHDNAPAHASKAVKDTLKDLNWEVIPHPPYSPDLAPSDYHLFTSMANALCLKRFIDYEDVSEWVKNWFEEKGEKFYERGIRKLPERWQSCIASNGAYFE